MYMNMKPIMQVAGTGMLCVHQNIRQVCIYSQYRQSLSSQVRCFVVRKKENKLYLYLCDKSQRLKVIFVRRHAKDQKSIYVLGTGVLGIQHFLKCYRMYNVYVQPAAKKRTRFVSLIYLTTNSYVYNSNSNTS